MMKSEIVSISTTRRDKKMEKPLLVFAPGWSPFHGTSKFPMDVLKRRLRNEYGREAFNTLTLSYPDVYRRSIRSIVGLDCRPMLHNKKRTRDGNGPVVLIGHSMGGLVGRLLFDEIDEYISICTPHQGTEAAAIMPSFLSSSILKTARDMSPGSKLLKYLAYPPKSRTLNIRIEHDLFISPNENSKLTVRDGEEPYREVTIERGSHALAPTSYQVYGEIISYLEYEKGILDERASKH